MSERTKVRARVQELIPTAKYANVEIDLEIFAESSVYVDDETPKGIEQALSLAYDSADRVLQSKRDPIMDELEGN